MKITLTLRNVLVVLVIIINQQTNGADEGPTWPISKCEFTYHKKRASTFPSFDEKCDLTHGETECKILCSWNAKCGTYEFSFAGTRRCCRLMQGTPQLGETLTGIKAEKWTQSYAHSNIGIKKCNADIPEGPNGWVKQENMYPNASFWLMTLQAYDRPLSERQCQAYCTGWANCKSVVYWGYTFNPEINVRCSLSSKSIKELMMEGNVGYFNRSGYRTFDRPESCAEGGTASLKRSAQDTHPSFGEEHRSLADAGDKTQNTLDDQPGQDLVASSQLLDKDGAGSNTGESDHQAPAPESPGA